MSQTVTVVIAEDDEGHATLIQRSLRRVAMPVDSVRVRDGQELLDYMYRRGPWQGRARHNAIVILLDLNMPRIGGLEVLGRLQRDLHFAHIPVCVLTTSDNPVELDQCFARGATACLVKPVEFGLLGDMVRRLGEFLVMARLPPETRPSLQPGN